ncbi:SusD/RagB family nutrient-binding outer membrane lipoprotein [Chitinophaga japonensis]
MLALVAAGSFTACKKSQFDEKYYDPEKTTVGTIDGLYTGLFKNRRVFPNYRHMFTFLGEITGRYTQSIGFVNDNKMYEPNPDYVEDRWSDFYTAPGSDWTAPLSIFREMEKIHEGLGNEEEKEGYLLFMETARIFVYDQAAQQVDIWGDIPFSTAGQLNYTGELTLATFDEGAAVYDFILTDLKRISNWLATVQPSQFYMNKLAKQDILLKGDLLKWRRYANSLMLRLAMRISYVQESRAQTLVQEILGNPTLYPLIDVITDNVQITAAAPNLLTTDMNAAWTEFNHNLAPGYMVDSLMEPAGDPRLRVFYELNTGGQYQGVPTSWNTTQQENAIGAGLISRLDTVTFLRNEYFPGIVITAAEVSFLKAEAYQRWGGGTARTAYETGIRQSIAYYFQIHNLSQYNGTKETPYTEAEITLLLANPLVAYNPADEEGSLNKIALQKWVDFGPMLAPQAWAEMRRSGYPKLSVPVDGGSTLVPTPPARLLYPSTERNLNAKNYEAVAAKDLYTTKVFWVR